MRGHWPSAWSRPTDSGRRTAARPARSGYARLMQRQGSSVGSSEPDWHLPVATGPVRARVVIPGSKSMTNRALVLAALSEHPTVISRPLTSRDSGLMAAAIAELGADVRQSDEQWLVTPARQAGPGRDVRVDVGNAGTVLRFVPPLAALTTANVEFAGDARIAQRPVAPLLTALRELGASISDGGRGAAPFTVHGRGAIPGGAVTIDASSSSQLVSALLLAAPRFGKGVEVHHEGAALPSRPHIEMTVAMLRLARADVEVGPGSRWRVHPGPLRPVGFEVESDVSNAAPFLAAALVTGGEVTIEDWPAASVQPAARVLELLTAMGGTGTVTGRAMRFTGNGTISAISDNVSDVSEVVPVLAALAALADSPSVLRGVGHMRGHETDRLAALAAEIGRLGGDVTQLPDGLVVRPRPLRANGTALPSRDDHRLVMAWSVLGLVVPGLAVRGSATVGKTFPEFRRTWQQMVG